MELDKREKVVCGACGNKGFVPRWDDFDGKNGLMRSTTEAGLVLLRCPRYHKSFIRVGIEIEGDGGKYHGIGIACPECGALRVDVKMPIDKEI